MQLCADEAARPHGVRNPPEGIVREALVLDSIEGSTNAAGGREGIEVAIGERQVSDRVSFGRWDAEITRLGPGTGEDS